MHCKQPTFSPSIIIIFKTNLIKDKIYWLWPTRNTEFSGMSISMDLLLEIRSCLVTLLYQRYPVIFLFL